MSDRAALPGWPRYLSREQAAAYVGVSMSTFDLEVAGGQWPPPRCRGAKLTKMTWDRLLLDAYADQAAGPLLMSTAAAQPSLDALEQASLAAAEAVAIAGAKRASTKHRPQHRQQTAA